MKYLLREPLIHFLIGAGLVFAFFKIVGSEAVSESDTIVIEQGQIDRLIGRWQGTWRRVPTETERAGLIENLIQDEILYREGLRLGLDQHDAVVRNRMIQKMRFLQDEALTEPSEEALQNWLDNDPRRYQKSDLYSFEHRFFGQKTEPEAIELQLQALRSDSEIEDISTTLFNLPSSMRSASKGMISQRFGENFAEQIANLKRQEWSGPVQSGFGLHLVRINDKENAAPPSLDELSTRQQVENDWRTEQRKLAHARQIDALRERYTIKIDE